MRYLRSRYNFFTERPEGTVGYNARTGDFALLSPRNAGILRGGGGLAGLGDKRALLRMGFVHRGDEARAVRQAFAASRSARALHVTILPTLACNVSCAYCFQSALRTNEVMRPEAADRVLAFLSASMDRGWKAIQLTWFGGEPLICTERIVSMTRALSAAARRKRVRLQASMVSNGVLLDGATARALARVGIRNVQVSFDTLREQPGMRGLLSADGSPSRILRNALGARRHLGVHVRLNVTRQNAPDVPRMLELLFASKLDVVLAHIYDYEAEARCATRADGARVRADGDAGHGCSLSRAEFAALETRVYLRRPETAAHAVHKLRPKSAACAASAGRMLVIGPDGSVSHCWHSAGAAREQVGGLDDVAAEAVGRSPVAARWRAYTPFDGAECRRCPVLPLCMGGCAHPRIFMSPRVTPCDTIRFNVQDYVDHVGRAVRLPRGAARA